MKREEGHYTLKRVDKLPKRGNANLLYILKSDPIEKFYRWQLRTGGYEELNIGPAPSSYELSDTLGGVSTVSLIKDGVVISTVDLSSYLDNTDDQTITDFSFDSLNSILSISIEDGNTMQVDLSALNTSSSFVPDIVVNDYDALLLVTGQQMFEFAEVLNPQGTPYLPGSLGGTYRAAGLYYWNGTSWIHDNDEILKGLQDLTSLVTSLETVVYITSDYTIPDSTSFVGTLRIKNVSANTLNVNTEPADKFETEDTQEIFPNEAFTIKLYQANDYRLM